MNCEDGELTLAQARERVLARLAVRWPKVSFRDSEDQTLVCRFGWIFMVEVTAVGRLSDLSHATSIPRLVLVNKTSGQTIATSRSYTAREFAKVFEGLLARSQANARNWCLTLDAHLGDPPRGIAETARAAGLEELT
jgi:hypothetical protein